MVTAHLLDCLSVCAYVQGSRIADVGSGAGLPGIPLAICCNEKKFLLLDSSAKKTRFLYQVVSELALSNVDIEQTRVESYQARHQCDTVICRAFGSLVQFVTTAGPLCKRSGRMLAMKGRYPAGELIDLPKGFELVAVHKLDVPGTDAQRHLIEIVRL
jgi:16S rRNA (guanine527-N7)-methyltransferase